MDKRLRAAAAAFLEQWERAVENDDAACWDQERADAERELREALAAPTHCPVCGWEPSHVPAAPADDRE